jgi:catechol 2,3-dioxygenase-like lactoylglutathione lyase family enzyme
MHLRLATIVVNDYDSAISFFTDTLGFELVEDTPATTHDGRPKRWVVVRPPGEETGLMLGRADSDAQAAAVGMQVGDRTGFILRVDDFDEVYERLCAANVTFVRPPMRESYGKGAVFLDVVGNRWEIVGP